MTIRFAGSRFVHERRRRRLAQECGGVSAVPVDETQSRGSDDSELPQPSPLPVEHSPICSIIRPQLWVHWIITVLCLAAWAGMLYLGDLAERTDFGLRDILGLRSGRLTTFFSTIMLLWAGQLSLLIYWYRRKSRNDFAGRYRMWLWICGILQIFLAVAATGAHVPFAEYMQRIWPLDIPLYGLFCWLVPVATLGLAMFRLLRIEVKRHRSGLILLNLAGVAAIVAGGSLVVAPFLPDRWCDLVQIGSATLCHLGLATALLMHSRYVIHISNEAPRKERQIRRLQALARTTLAHLPLPKARQLRLPKPAWLKNPLPKLGLRMMRLPKVSLPKVGRRKAKQVKESTAEIKKTPAKGAQTASTPNKSAALTTASPSPSASVETRAVVTSRKTGRERPDHTSRHRVDSAEALKGPRRAAQQSLDDIIDEFGSAEAVDAETLRGLSKKERRRLRKKQRGLQRTGS